MENDKEILKNGIELTVADVWYPTVGLRYVATNVINFFPLEKVYRLQQLWRSNTGKEEWREVPKVEELA